MVKIIKASTSGGSLNRGAELSPDYLLSHGLESAFKKSGIEYEILDDINLARPNKLNDLNFLRDFNNQIYQLALNNIKNDDILLTIGGDHSISIGSMFATKKLFSNAKIIYIDAHPDCNDLNHTPTGNIHGMSLSTVMGDGLYDKFKLPKYSYEECVIFGAKDIDDFEAQYIYKNKIRSITIQDILHNGIGRSVDDLLDFAGDYSLHISLDVDSIDQMFAPATGISNQGGLTYREIKYICQKLASKKICSIDLVEFNPKLDIDDKTLNLSIELILTLLKKDWSNYQNYLSSSARLH